MLLVVHAAYLDTQLQQSVMHAGYNALLPGSKRKSPDAMPLHIFSDSSVHNM